MSEKIALPDGGWALLRDAKQVPERLRRPILLAMPELNAVDPEHLDAAAFNGMFDLKDMAILAFVQEWSSDGPVTVEAIQDLPAASYDCLDEAVGPLIGQLVGSTTNPADPKSPPTASPSSATG